MLGSKWHFFCSFLFKIKVYCVFSETCKNTQSLIVQLFYNASFEHKMQLYLEVLLSKKIHILVNAVIALLLIAGLDLTALVKMFLFLSVIITVFT